MPNKKNQKILILGDDMRLPSGVGRMIKNITYHLLDKYDVIQLAGSANPSDAGKKVQLPTLNNKSIILYPTKGYGSTELIRLLIRIESPDAILHVTDPRYWEWLYDIEDEIRRQCPILYYHVWDNFPAPMYNKSYYDSCDHIFCISKLTKLVVNEVSPNIPTTYVPHGIDETIFKPVDLMSNPYKYNKILSNIFKNAKYDIQFFKDNYTFLFNNRNIPRKNIGTILESFASVPNAFLILKTNPTDPNGTNIYEMANSVGLNLNQYIIIPDILSDQDLNVLYNASTATLNVASQEGWGLSSTESMMSGTPIINTVTGGLQDQCNFTITKNNESMPILGIKYINGMTYYREEYNSDLFPAHQYAHGDWAFPIMPIASSLIGTIKTPYLYDDKILVSDLVRTIKTVMSIDKNNLAKRGYDGHKFAMAHYRSVSMGNMIATGIDDILKSWIPRTKLIPIIC